jgi:hypothetical protein
MKLKSRFENGAAFSFEEKHKSRITAAFSTFGRCARFF